MMIVLLLLCTFVCMGFSHGSYQENHYGGSHYFWLPIKTHSIEFSSKNNSNVTILWKHGDPLFSVDKKRIMGGISYMMSNVTQTDSGRYIMRDKDQNVLSTHILEVKATTRNYERKHGERLGFGFNLESNSCNIYFFPESDHQPRELKFQIVRQGKLQRGLDELRCLGFNLSRACGISNNALQMSCNGRFEVRDLNDNTALEVLLKMERTTKTYVQKPGEQLHFTFDLETNFCNIYFIPENDHQPTEFKVEIVRHGWIDGVSDEYGCVGFHMLKPCGILIEALQMSCNGRFEVRDQNDDMPFEVSLEMEPLPYEPSHIGIGAGIFFSLIFCCCVRQCCCGKSSAKKNGSETAAEPAEDCQENDSEPVGPRRDQLSQTSWTHYPAPPAYTPTCPLIHRHSTLDVPPAYSEISAPAEQADDPTVPVHSDSEPQFDLTGMNFPSASLLSTDSIHCDVYTSDKLN